MPRFTQRRERLRALLAGTECVYPGSVFDPISARIAERVGYDLGMFAGSIASLTVLGAPDLVVLTLTEFAEQAGRICRAAQLPLLCDADHGYGNALNVMRTVEELERAGVAGFSIEDTVLPHAHGSDAKPRLTSIEEAVGKLKAALAARYDSNLMIAGRTSSPSITDVADTIRRVEAYQETGVDAIFLVGVKNREDLDAIAARIRLPIILGGAGPAMRDLSYLAQRGVRVCLQGHQPFMAAIQAVHTTMQALHDGVAPEALSGVAPSAMVQQFSHDDDYTRRLRDYL